MGRVEQEDAATKLQAMARARSAAQRVDEKRDIKDGQHMQEAAHFIQRCYRGHEGREAMREKKEHTAACAIQSRYRKMVCNSEVRSLRDQKQRRLREEQAATTLQGL